MEYMAVILPAAGRSVRFGGPRNKLHELLAGATVIHRSVSAFLARADVAQVIIATQPPSALEPSPPPPIEAFDRRIEFTPGGESRAHSVWHALREVSAEVEWVAVHDAARPLVSRESRRVLPTSPATFSLRATTPTVAPCFSTSPGSGSPLARDRSSL